MNIYLDHAATTPLNKEVAELMFDISLSHFGNPSSTHSFGRKSKSLLEFNRKSVAENLGALPSEIYFTSGGTESNNHVLRMCVENLDVKTIISSKIEHHAVTHTLEDLEKNRNTTVLFVQIKENGHIDLKHLEQLLKENNNVLVSLMHVNNEIGNILDIEAVGTLTQKHQALFHSDMVQSIGILPINFGNLNIDFASGSAHKFNGPKGVGVLYCKKKNKLKPLITGGSQERDLRAGTENISGIAGLTKALDINTKKYADKKAKIETIKQYFINKIESDLPDIKFNGDYKQNSSYTILSIALPPTIENGMLLFNFDLNGISVSGGSACSSGSSKGSHVFQELHQHIGYSPIRFSFGETSTQEEIDFVIDFIKTLF